MTPVVFVDSWAWIAMLDDRDPHHHAALDAYERLHHEDAALVTTSVVVHEGCEHLRREHGWAFALEYMTRIEEAAATVLHIVWVGRELETHALELAAKFHDQDVSFVDLVSFATMRSLGLQTAFTGDKDYFLLGFNTIPDIPRGRGGCTCH